MQAKIELFMLKGIIKCILVNACIYKLYFLEMNVLTTETMCLLLTLEVENFSGVVRYCKKKVAG